MNLVVAATTFALVFVAELPDKTAVASLLLASRYPAGFAFAGAAAGFVVHVVLALVAGGLLGLLPHRWLDAVVAVLFGAGAVLLLWSRNTEDEEKEVSERAPLSAPTFTRVALTSFSVIIVAEFGDLTQILIVNLAARYHDPLAVGIGALLALWAVAGLAMAGGRALQRVVPVRLITIVGAAAMAVLAVISLVGAIRG